ncbi:MAG: hypothetical protein HRF50_15125 [Phycisphaerae bacterium]|jgi:hypothetical protein
MLRLTHLVQSVAAIGLMTAILAGTTGCDELGILGGGQSWSTPYVPYDPWGMNTGYNGWGTGYSGWGGGYPEYGLYDPTSVIEDVYTYRQEVYDNVNAGWSDYILQ